MPKTDCNACEDCHGCPAKCKCGEVRECPNCGAFRLRLEIPVGLLSSSAFIAAALFLKSWWVFLPAGVQLLVFVATGKQIWLKR